MAKAVAFNFGYDAGFEDGRRAGFAEAANVLMEHRNQEFGARYSAVGFLDAPR